MDGFLLLDKARDARSTSCVQHLRHVLGKRTKVGHAGTLDSSAEGLLILLIGKATLWADMVMNLPKTYFVSALFGTSTDTDDASGKEISSGDASVLSESRIDTLCLSFLGWRLQTPPDISAVKINGIAAHKLARSGEIPKTKPRPVFVRNLSRRTQLDDDACVDFTIVCSRGTYVRSVVRDMGNALGCGGHVHRLRRMSTGSLRVESAVGQDDFLSFSENDVRARLLPVDVVLDHYTWYGMSAEQSEALLHGKGIALSGITPLRYGAIPSHSGILVVHENHVAFCKTRLFGSTLFAIPQRNILISARGNT